MVERGFFLALQLRHDSLSQLFSQFDTPLVERVNAPNHTLREDTVFVERDEFTKILRRQAFRQDRIGGPIAFEDAVGHQPIGRPLGPNLLCRLPKGQCLALSKHIGHQDIMMPANRIERVSKGDEVTGNQPRPLMDQLIKGVLAVGSRFTEVHLPRLGLHPRTIERDILAIALHRQLLQVRRKTFEVLFVRQDSDRFGSKKIGIPE